MDPAQWALGERVKELTCLYGVSQIAWKHGITMPEMAAQVVALLPPAWQYPNIASARILLDGQSFLSEPFAEGPFRQSAEIVVEGTARGKVEVFYIEECPAFDEGPFLKEERSLLDEVAHQLSLVAERKDAEAERERLQEHLLRADRMATIGKLAAGVAHELNEPLGAILGYAQLSLKSFGLADQTGRNMEKIVKASLHAREIIRKLLLFSRQTAVEKRPVSINALVKESLYLIESRCAKSGVQVVLRLGKDLPELLADAGQIQQVVLNLCINAIQAMSGGGTLRVITDRTGEFIRLAVEDTGKGMEEEVVRQIFTPFFTTKDVGQGTGLGLSVVHGIVDSHGGRIDLATTPGKGTRVDVLLPVAVQELGGG
jgi:signal transduction histidine kinase